MQQCARKPKPLLLAQREHPVPVRFLVKPRAELRQADQGQDIPDPVRAEGLGLGGIDDRRVQRPDREIGLLRQRHQRSVRGN